MLVRVYHAIAGFLGRVLDRILLIDEAAALETEAAETQTGDAEATHVPDDTGSPQTGEATPTGDGRVYFMHSSPERRICIARPRNIEEAEQVGERLKRHMPVILNLESTDEAMAQRIADYMSGAVHMVDAKIAKGGRMVWVYAPVDMDVEMLKVDQEQPRSHLFDEEEPPTRRAVGL
ncbi:MAG: cell division protein SepF [Armatimonadetes bacterium]|nr:cell division protein SepF [Armatimonadota bacterium]